MRKTSRRVPWLAAAVLSLGSVPAARAEDAPPAAPPAPAAPRTKPAPAAPPAAPAPAAADPAWKPLLWVVEGKPRIYVFGTLHFTDKRFSTWPRVVEEAHASADVVYVEVKNEELDPMKLQPRLLLPEGQTLADVVPAATLERLHAYLEKRGLGAEAFDRYRPWVVATILAQLDHLAEMGLREPMDKLVYGIAQRAGREVDGLETVDEQFSIFESLTNEQNARKLDAAITTLEKGKETGADPMTALTDVFLRGDAEGLLKLVADAEAAGDEENKKFLADLLYKRNALMVERLLERTKDKQDKTVFVAVGAAHLPGERGVLALLAKKGLAARRVGVTEEIPARPRAPTTVPAR